MLIRPWRLGDEILAVAAEPVLSARSLDNRFLVGAGGRLPSEYLRQIAKGPRPIWDANVAVRDDMLIGWAEFGRRSATDDDADLGVLVLDPWHRQGVATALIRELLPRAYAAGVRRLTADVLPSNDAAHRMLAKVFGRTPTWQYAGAVVHYEFELSRLMALTG